MKTPRMKTPRFSKRAYELAQVEFAKSIHAQCECAEYSTYQRVVDCVHTDSKYYFIADTDEVGAVFVRTTVQEWRDQSMPDMVVIDDLSNEDAARIEAAIEDHAEDRNALFDELYAKADRSIKPKPIAVAA